MTIRKKGKFYYGDTIEDLQAEMRRWSSRNGYTMDVSVVPRCECGSDEGFTLSLALEDGVDEDGETGAILDCPECDARLFVCDTESHLDPEGDTIYESVAACSCGAEPLQVVVGAALYEGSQDVRWWYVGGRCSECELVAVYGSWKDDGSPWASALRPPQSPEAP